MSFKTTYKTLKHQWGKRQGMLESECCLGLLRWLRMHRRTPLVEMGLEMGHMVQIITPTDSINLWFCRVIRWLLGCVKLIKEDMKHKTYL